MEGNSSLDLTHLTEEEQSAILQVLQRDLDLQLADEGRVRCLQQKETDPQRLRSLSGAWFTEECNKRHRAGSASALVHSSIRHRRTRSRASEAPLTELFNGEAEGGDQDRRALRAERRLEASRAEESEGSLGGLTPRSPPRTRRPRTEEPSHSCSSSSSSSKESDKRSNGFLSQLEDDFDGRNRNTESWSNGMMDPEPTGSLRNSSSSSSLQSSTTLGGSMMSLFSSGDFGAVEVRGRIQFSLLYDHQRGELHVRVHRCKDLASARRSRCDPYVKSYLLPDLSSDSKKKTSVRKKMLNPVYEQTLRYSVSVGELRGRTLNLSVWHAEPLGRNVFLGEVEVPLGLWDWSNTQPLWQDLQPRIHLSPDSISSRGTIVFSIKFIPDGSEGGGLPLTGELHIWLREAQGLLAFKGGPIDSFVRSYILPDARRESGQKTRMVKRSVSPAYNHTMVYDGFHASDLREACAELTVWQRDGLKRHLLGGVRLSCGTGQSYGEAVGWMDSTEEEVAVWISMIQNQNHWVDATLPVRTDLAHWS